MSVCGADRAGMLYVSLQFLEMMQTQIKAEQREEAIRGASRRSVGDVKPRS